MDKEPRCIYHESGLRPMIKTRSVSKTQTCDIMISADAWKCPECGGYWTSELGYHKHPTGTHAHSEIVGETAKRLKCPEHGEQMFAFGEKDGVISFICFYLPCRITEAIPRTRVMEDIATRPNWAE